MEPIATAVRAPGEGPLYQKLYRSLRTRILAGELPPGARLPASRVLAAALGISRNVVLLAYEQLLAEGYLDARVGSGTIVAPALEERLLLRPGAPPKGLGRAASPALSKVGRRALELLETTRVRWELRGSRLPYDFRFGRPSFGDFPHAAWCRLLGRRSRGASLRDLDYGPPEGRKELREALARHLRRSRGIDAPPERIVVVNGTQQAIDLVARVLVDPGDAVVLEEPHYLGARWAFHAAGARIVPAPVDDDGMTVPRVSERVRLAYVTPSHQFPTGVVMPLARRLDLLSWAEASDAVLVEDDYDSEYHYGGRPVQALQGIDRSGRVVYTGTFSKVLFPALRIGYLVLPEPLVKPVLAAKALADTGSASLEQLALADFIAEGHFERHLHRSRERNARRRTALLAAIRESFGDHAEVAGANAGLHVLVWLRGVAGGSIGRRAAEAGVGVYTVAPYYLRPPRRTGLLLGYASLTEREIREGIRRLAAALR